MQHRRTISGNTTEKNGTSGTGHGISAGTASSVTGNVSRTNADDGIHCLRGCTVAGNTIEGNGGTSADVTDDGIEVGEGSHVYGNTVRAHTGWGLRGTVPFGHRDNVFTENNSSSANQQVNASGGTDLGGNICGDGPCP